MNEDSHQTSDIRLNEYKHYTIIQRYIDIDIASWLRFRLPDLGCDESWSGEFWIIHSANSAFGESFGLNEIVPSIGPWHHGSWELNNDSMNYVKLWLWLMTMTMNWRWIYCGLCAVLVNPLLFCVLCAADLHKPRGFAVVAVVQWPETGKLWVTCPSPNKDWQTRLCACFERGCKEQGAIEPSHGNAPVALDGKYSICLAFGLLRDFSPGAMFMSHTHQAPVDSDCETHCIFLNVVSH